MAKSPDVPQHLLDRSAAHRASLESEELEQVEAEETARREMVVSKMKLPTPCRGCIFRPEEAGGNGGCLTLNTLLADLDGLASMLSVSKENRHGANSRVLDGVISALQDKGLDDREAISVVEANVAAGAVSLSSYLEGYPKAYLGLGRHEVLSQSLPLMIGKAAEGQADRLRAVLTSQQVGVAEKAPQPFGDTTVQICIRSLSDAVRPEAVVDINQEFSIDNTVRAAQALAAARKAGIEA